MDLVGMVHSRECLNVAINSSVISHCLYKEALTLTDTNIDYDVINTLINKLLMCFSYSHDMGLVYPDLSKPFSTIELLLMAALLRRPMNQYRIGKSIKSTLSYGYEPPKTSLKRAIDRLIELGYVKYHVRKPHYWDKPDNRHAKLYELTDEGRRVIERQLSDYLLMIEQARTNIRRYEADMDLRPRIDDMPITRAGPLMDCYDLTH